MGWLQYHRNEQELRVEPDEWTAERGDSDGMKRAQVNFLLVYRIKIY